jgi:hypothetical protein
MLRETKKEIVRFALFLILSFQKNSITYMFFVTFVFTVDFVITEDFWQPLLLLFFLTKVFYFRDSERT